MSTKIDTVDKKWLSRNITKTNVVFTKDLDLTSENSIDCSGTSYLEYNFLNTSSYMGIQLTANLSVKTQSVGAGTGNHLSFYLNCGSPQSRYIKLIVNKTGTFNMNWTATSGSVTSKILYVRLYARVNGVNIVLSTYQKSAVAGTAYTVPEWAHNGTYIIDTVDNKLIYKNIRSSESEYSESSFDGYENIFRAVIPNNWWDSKSTYSSDILPLGLFLATQTIQSSSCVPALTKLYPKYVGKTIEISYTNLVNNAINVTKDSTINILFHNEVNSGMKHVKVRLVGIPTLLITKAGVTLTVNIDMNNYDEITGNYIGGINTKTFTWEYTAPIANSSVELSNKEFYIDIVNNTLLSTELNDNDYTSAFYKAIKK